MSESEVKTSSLVETLEPATIATIGFSGVCSARPSASSSAASKGPAAAKAFAEILKTSKTILWNGPVGVFEVDQFGEGTKTLSLAIAESEGFSIAGGGDTLAAIDKYEVADKIGYISTGGGAFLEFVEGKTLPAVAVLLERA